jgi:predicted RNase H-like HicB family nuclease
MYKMWYWMLIDRESDGRFVASVPDLEDIAAWGPTDKEAVGHATQLARDHVRALQENGQPVPLARSASEMPSSTRPREIGRAMISVEVGRAAAPAGVPFKTEAA